MFKAFSILALLSLSAVNGVQLSHGQRHVSPHHHGGIDQNSSGLIKNDALSYSSLSRRDDYACGPGSLGNCGYGPLYCGDGCSSNCDAAAECGQHAKTPGKTCPLNTWYLTSVVIGYWEAWNARSSCHNTQASDLPLQALTHVNYAFAYIDPNTFEITTMDPQTPISTFQDIVSLKDLKPDLKVFVSIGGWTFSDNDTATQPVFGNIARSENNRQRFANKLLKFMNGYGFDGVDLDWEYPGAPDRGGKPDDTVNYVSLMKTLKSTFDRSGRDLELTFTAPSSFWYLRWFDLPGMMKYADWVNLMSYDLHGVWDKANPIGPIVQAHTNLTEIKLAAELFWRVNIPPSKIALGYGFYGRAFTLADPNCKTPGCPFSGGAKKGPCTGTSGYLAHYEIQDILDKNKKRDLTVVHDKKAAVKYITWDNDQWISYDDADTFKQKQDWANSVGFSGSLIWASDLDDYNHSAHTAFTGIKDLGSRKELKKVYDLKEYVETVDSFLGQGCKFFKTVVPNVNSHDCGKDMELVAYDTHGCKGNKKHKDWQCGWPMCCPKTASMKDKCMWRGSGGDCNGQCHANEVKIGGSSWGGYPGEGKTGRCSRGGKALCCNVQVEAINEGCYWTKGCDNKKCASDEVAVAHAFSINNSHKCVKELPPLRHTCRWVGKGDCAKNTCDRGEVTLATDRFGDNDDSCNWWRSKALCCKPNQDSLNTPICDADLCADNDCEDPDEWLTERSIDGTGHHIDKRVRSSLRRYLTIDDIKLALTSAPHPNGFGELFKGAGVNTLSIKGGFMWDSTSCRNLGAKFVAAGNIPQHLLTWSGSGNRWNVEHYREFKNLDNLLVTAATGVLLTGNKLKAAKMKMTDISKAWNAQYPASAVLTNLGQAFVTGVKGYGTPDRYGNDWNKLTTPNMRFHTVLGSVAYRYSLTFVPNDINRFKAALLATGKTLISSDKFSETIAIAAGTDIQAATKAVNELLTALQRVYVTVAFYNDAFLGPYFDKANSDMYALANEMAEHFPGWESFPAIMKEFDDDVQKFATNNAQKFMLARAGAILDYFKDVDLSTSAEHVVHLVNIAKYYIEQKDKLKFAGTSV
ncbi:glycoside hydrolase family 18 protein [Aaosphaeria arxii CBS 175.79]|uniref:chitinase n=1 Tax=Aaosphaeria arxii CBS 175.79 TaxID=1450172 RepID=A0A6A5X816_9PLEO|nr:glycoside hydrolase family 18 protein [Aaosphaeria arxii CBS 175.79]KAF2009039.1 glycoside hydrolase family 18 protein [Aaosphaeria arxii CBS 175.79]